MSIDPKKILTEEGWDAVAPDCKGKDKELKRALLFYWTLEDDDFEFRTKALTKIAALAGSLKSAREVTVDSDAVKYLVAMIGATKTKQAELAKAKVEAQKAEAAVQKKVELETKKKEQAAAQEAERAAEAAKGDDDDDDDQGDSFARLTKALQALKSAKDPYYFLFCKDKPYGLIVSKRDITKNSQAKKELSQMAGGSTTPPRFGRCLRDGSKLVFEMEKPLPGMARILQKWIKENTSLGFKVMVGDESADDEENPAAEQPRIADAAEPGKPKGKEAELPPVSPKLAKAPEMWRATQRSITTSVQQLQAAVRKSLQGEPPALVKEVEQNVVQLDGLGEMLGDDLPEFLKRAIAAKDPTKRNNELKEAKTLLVAYLKLVKGQGAELIAHIDSNPFGVKTNLKKTLTDGLTQMAEAIGTPA